MSRDLKTMTGILVAMLMLMVAVNYMRSTDEYPASKLTLSIEGCAYGRSIGLRPEQADGQCTLVARYRPYVFGDGGVLLMDDDSTIAVTGTMMLAYTRLGSRMPLTAGQQSDVRRSRIWLVAAILMTIWTLGYWMMSRTGKHKR